MLLVAVMFARVDCVEGISVHEREHGFAGLELILCRVIARDGSMALDAKVQSMFYHACS
jgi:hypothetical protein